MQTRGKYLLAAKMLLLAAGLGVCAPAFSQPKLETNQEFIEELGKPGLKKIDDVLSTLEFILSSLPKEVTVYPTENYYYFSFYNDGVKYAGNLRLATRDRDQGIIHFAYFAAANTSSDDGEMYYKPLDKKDGVEVKKLGELEYSVSYKGRMVIFNLNDVSGIKPPEGYLVADEDYLGPVYDESGIQFYLVYNRNLRIFHYLLNDSAGVPEVFYPSSVSERILIGKRSGFAFYNHHKLKRKILIGVHSGNADENNYYDGPFDQLPDNLNKDDRLRKAIEEADPSAAGQLDRFGYLKSGEGRYLIGPYMHYTDVNELASFEECAKQYVESQDVYNGCFAIQGGGEGEQQEEETPEQKKADK